MADRVLLACKVAAVVDDAIILNRGADDGVEVGMTFALGELVRITDPVTDEYLGAVDQRPRIRVADTRAHISVAHPTRYGHPVQTTIGETATVVVDAPPVPPPVPNLGSDFHIDTGAPWTWRQTLALLTIILGFAGIVTMIMQGWR